MAKIYYKRIKAEIMTIEEVPQMWRAAVQALIDAEEATHGED
jgi:predicted secreted protein